jgi:uncharacterized protein (DUF1778 family)
MARESERINADPLAPARTRAEWEAQGWAFESEPLTTAPRLETTISIRFDAESAALLRRAARLRGLTKSQFVRQATLQEARKTIEETPQPASMWVSVSETDGVETRGRAALGQPSPTVTTTAISIDLAGADLGGRFVTSRASTTPSALAPPAEKSGSSTLK